MNSIYQKECESSCEYTLPDYMGDVKKILTVSSTTIPSGKFVGEGSVDFSGIVSYDILYSDSEGKLTKITTSSDYDVSQTVDIEKYNDSAAECRVASSSIRLSGPRKMALRSSLILTVRVSESEDICCAGDAFDDEEMLEVAKKTVNLETVLFASSPEREYAEEAAKIAAVVPDEVEIIGTSGSVRIIESTPADGGVTVKGELIITSIIRTDEQPPFAIKKVVPFEENISLEGVSADMQVLADGYLTSVTTGLAEEADGCSVTVNAICELDCIAGSNTSLSINTDAYLKNKDTECEYEDFGYTELVAMANCEQSVVYDVPRAEIGCENAREILMLTGEVKSIDKKAVGGRLMLSGDIAISGVACEINEENSVAYIPVKFNFPFETNVNTSCQIPEESLIECFVTCVDADSALDSQMLSVKCALKIRYRVAKKMNVKRLKSCVASGEEEYSAVSSRITVYYPDDKDTLFGIAKKFHTSSAKIAADNNLSEPASATPDSADSLLGVKKVIIR